MGISCGCGTVFASDFTHLFLLGLSAGIITAVAVLLSVVLLLRRPVCRLYVSRRSRLPGTIACAAGMVL